MQTAAGNPQQQAALAQIQSQYGADARSKILKLSAVILVIGFLYLLLGLVVRRGGAGATYTAMVLVILALLWSGLEILAAVTMGGQLPPVQLAGGVCVLAVIACGNLAALVWLVNAARNVRRIRELKDYQRNYYMYAQQQQAAYQQGFYGQGTWPGYPQPQQPPQQPQPPQHPNWPPQPPQ
ncbi:MAG: hypothetical protein ACHRHE_05605 [Tepidisphaerales bacterium]